MRCIFPLVFALVVALHSNAAVASDGNRLLQACGDVERFKDGGNSRSNLMGIGFCFGLMEGITFSNELYKLRAPGKEFLCLPKGGVTNGQAARVVLRYLRDHPEQLHENAFFLAVMALRDAFPCSW